MKRRALSVLVAAVMAGAIGVLGSPGAASGQSATPRIVGGLGNFDCYNTTCQVVDCLEIEIDGVSSSDVVGYWRSYRYGYPVLSTTPTGVKVTYGGPGRGTVQVGTYEHFGIHFRYGFPSPSTSSIRYTWFHNGLPITCGTPPICPFPTVVVNPPANPAEPPEIVEAIENTEPEPIWVQRRAVVVPGGVALADLMSDNPAMRDAPEVDPAPRKVDAGEIIEINEPGDDNGGLRGYVIAYDIYANVRTFVNGEAVDAPGALVSTMMASSNTEPESDDPSCTAPPVIERQPLAAVLHEGDIDGLDIKVNTSHTDVDPTYQWFKDGVPLADGPRYLGVNADSLDIVNITPEDAGLYTCSATNACGTTISDSALLTVVADNPERTCHIDWNDDNSTNPDDLGDYITGYFSVPPVPGCEFTDDSVINPDDLGDFITAYFAGHC